MKRTLLAAVVLSLAGGCGGDATTSPTPKSQATISVQPTALDIAPGETATIVATVSNTSNLAVRYESSNESVVFVSSGGMVRGIAPGQATITASSVADPTATATVSVTVRTPVVVTVTPAAVTLSVGQEQQLTASATGPGNGAVRWVSNETAIAAVDGTGVVTGVAPGTTVVRAISVVDSTRYATAAITVRPRVTVAVSPPAVSLDVGASAVLTASVANAENDSVMWRSSDVAVARVSASGVVDALQAGSATITAIAVADTTARASAAVTVAARVSVSISPGSLNLPVGQVSQLVAAVTGTANSQVDWSSSSPAVATVSGTGVVTGVAPGTASISAVSVADTSARAQIAVTVAAPARVQLQALTPAVTGTTSTAGSVGTVTCDFRWTANVTGIGTATWDSVSWMMESAVTGPITGRSLATEVGALSRDFGPGVHAFNGRWYMAWTQDGQPQFVPFTLTISHRYQEAGSSVRVDTAPITMSCGAAEPGYDLTLSPDSLRLSPGSTANLRVTANPRGGFNGPITVWLRNLPTGVTAPTRVIFTGDTTTVVVSADATAAAGEWDLILTTTATGVPSRNTPVHLTVGSPPVVASLQVSPSTGTLGVGSTLQLMATARDASGNVVTGPAPAWSSSHPSVAAVSQAGLVTGASAGTATITAAVDGRSASAQVTVTESAGGAEYTNVAAGGNSACGLSQDGAAFCWGLGTGASVATQSNVPRRVSNDISFVNVTVGEYHRCGLTASGTAYCWGSGPALGDGSGTSTTVPVQVQGGLTFSSVVAGDYHTCGLTVEKTAYCWGNNSGGKLGNGTVGGQSTVPLPVAGNLSFVALAAGGYTCGLTASGAAYCWGYNYGGQLGTGNNTDSAVPVEVAGNLELVSISTGYNHSCGLTQSGSAHCWGTNYGRLGNGTTTVSSNVPVPVASNIVFAAVSAGGHTCGVSVTGAAYCWGNNDYGQLGTGSTVTVSTPANVAGGLTFGSIDAGGHATCGLATNGSAYCFGRNNNGQLGNGTTVKSEVPIAVLPPG